MQPTITDRGFAALCFLVLMDHHGDGYREAHPTYIDEKAAIAQMGPDSAYGMLDRENQLRVHEHLGKWGFAAPEKVREYEHIRAQEL